MNRNIAFVLAVFVAAMALLTSCSGGSRESDFAGESYKASSYTSYDSIPASEDFYGLEDSDVYSESPDSVKPDTMENDLANRKIIRNASLNFETKEYDSFIQKLKDCISSNSGYIQSSESNAGGIYYTRSRSSNITVRIPASRYDSFLNSIETIGTLKYKYEDIDDITMTYVDTQSHIRALETEYEALMSLLEKAESLSDILSLQSRITEINYQLDSYKSQIRQYDDLISYCTVRISISEVIRETVPVETQTFGERIKEGLTETFEELGEDFTDLAVFLIVNFPFIIIWAIVIFLVVLIIRGISKKRKKNREKKDSEAK